MLYNVDIKSRIHDNLYIKIKNLKISRGQGSILDTKEPFVSSAAELEKTKKKGRPNREKKKKREHIFFKKNLNCN